MRILTTLITFYMAAMFFTSCAAIKVKDIKPYKIVYFLNDLGQWCIPESITSKKLICRETKDIAADPVWKDHAMLIHDQNLAETLTDLLRGTKELTIEKQSKENK